MATTHFLKAAALGLLFSLLAGPGWGQSSEYTPRFIEKRKGPINIPRGQKYRFGYLEVPENRQVPDSK
ncbi:MAG TPA: hypothetical protein DCP28_29310, partial [Cytophagales bacterium]|nr:hypothetical protein [Cytophagales bacterium]